MPDFDCPLDPATVAADCRAFADEFRTALGRRVILPPNVVEHALIALLAGGHLLLEGNPGLGKHTLARWLARSVGLGFAATGFTSDVQMGGSAGFGTAGREVAAGREQDDLSEPSLSGIHYVENIDEAPAGIRALLVDAVRRSQVVSGSRAEGPEDPFMVIASRRPLASESPHPLNPSQLDRFLIQSPVRYPTPAEEWEIARRSGRCDGLSEPLRTADQLAALRHAATALELPEAVVGYAWALVRATRPGNEVAPDFVERWIKFGVSPCGLVALVSAARARALLQGRTQPTRQDVCAMARPVLGHRLIGNDEAAAASLSNDRLVGILLETVTIEGEYSRPAEEVAPVD